MEKLWAWMTTGESEQVSVIVSRNRSNMVIAFRTRSLNLI